MKQPLPLRPACNERDVPVILRDAGDPERLPIVDDWRWIGVPRPDGKGGWIERQFSLCDVVITVVPGACPLDNRYVTRWVYAPEGTHVLDVHDEFHATFYGPGF